MTTMTARSPAALCESMQNIDFSSVIRTMTNDMGFTPEDAQYQLEAFIQWFSCIPSVAPGAVYTMLKVPVDEVFHACVLDTAFYRTFTNEILGEFLDHTPIDKETVDVLDEGVRYTVKLLEETYGDELHPALAEWRQLLDSGTYVVSCVSCHHDDGDAMADTVVLSKKRIPVYTMWFANENFWEELYPYMFDDKRLARTPDEVSGIISLLDLKGSDEIIDFGCGTGRHLIELARRGFTKSIGVDSTRYYIDIAKNDAAKEGLSVKFEVGDMLTQSDSAKYTAVLSLFSSFGYYDEHEDNMKVLKNIHTSLKVGGKFLIDLRGKENFAYNFDEQSWGRSGNSLLLTQRTALQDFSKIENSWTIIRNGEEHSYSFTHWIYSARELKEMLRAVGFGSMKTYGGFTGSPYTHESKRLIIIATKI